MARHLGGRRPATACGVSNKLCELTVRAAVVALQCEGGSRSRSGARHCERGFARRICVNTQKMRDGPVVIDDGLAPGVGAVSAPVQEVRDRARHRARALGTQRAAAADALRMTMRGRHVALPPRRGLPVAAAGVAGPSRGRGAPYAIEVVHAVAVDRRLGC